MDLLDAAGPLEVFSLRPDGAPFYFDTFLVAESDSLVLARNGIGLVPKYTIHNCPEPDILVIPGGPGARIQANNLLLLPWIKKTAGQVEVLLSVCTGSLITAATGLLEDMDVTTHPKAFDELSKIDPSIRILHNARYVDNGHIVITGGVAAGIDGALHVVSKLISKEHAEKVAAHMCYEWKGEWHCEVSEEGSEELNEGASWKA
jgi:transcriptional regulator GlxA family with amidase domain